MNEMILASDHLRFLDSIDDEKYYVFTPSLLRVYPKSGNTRKITIKEIFTFLARSIHGYKVYIIADDKDRVKGATVISKGGSYRYPFATTDDLIEGPLFTVPQYRGTGVAVRLGKAITDKYEKNYNVIYATILNTNASSLKRFHKNGFVEVCHLRHNWIRKFIPDEKGNLTLVAYYNGLSRVYQKKESRQSNEE